MKVSLGDDEMDFQERARLRLAQIDADEKVRERQRQEGRKQGKLSQSLSEKIHSCTPTQLKNVISLARHYLQEYKKAPDLADIPYDRNQTVLAQQAWKNVLFILEVHPCRKANCKKCPHGPYVYSYRRDGRYFPATYHGANLSRLPRVVREKFRPIINEHKQKPA
jgi:hypothetical protein